MRAVAAEQRPFGGAVARTMKSKDLLVVLVLSTACVDPAPRLPTTPPPNAPALAPPVVRPTNPPEPGPNTVYDMQFRIKGQVRDSSGRAIRGASVAAEFRGEVFEALERVERLETTTDERGEFEIFAIAHVVPDTYTLVVAKPGFAEIRVENHRYQDDEIQRLVLQRKASETNAA